MIERIKKYGLVPMTSIEDMQNALPLAKALSAGGLPILEITLRSDCALQAISAISKEYPSMLIGAGTVLTAQQASDAIDAGAAFIVTPGFNAKVVRYCQSRNVSVFPGVMTPSEIEKAIECGVETVKLFPAEQAGGVDMIKALSGPYRNVGFIPTGGVELSNLGDYLRIKSVAACGGSFLAPKKLIQDKKFDDISSLVAEALKTVKEIRG